MGGHHPLLVTGDRLAGGDRLGVAREVADDLLLKPKRIESLAIQKLGMIPPGEGEAIIIERVSAPPPPDASVVAAAAR